MATPARPSSRAPRRRAFTLLELLVAMALTLLMVYGLAEFYSYVGDTVRDCTRHSLRALLAWVAGGPSAGS